MVRMRTASLPLPKDEIKRLYGRRKDSQCRGTPLSPPRMQPCPPFRSKRKGPLFQYASPLSYSAISLPFFLLAKPIFAFFFYRARTAFLCSLDATTNFFFSFSIIKCFHPPVETNSPSGRGRRLPRRFWRETQKCAAFPSTHRNRVPCPPFFGRSGFLHRISRSFFPLVFSSA